MSGRSAERDLHEVTWGTTRMSHDSVWGPRAIVCFRLVVVAPVVNVILLIVGVRSCSEREIPCSVHA